MESSEQRVPSFERAVAALRRGEPAAFPTDTVYGVGVAVDAAGSPDALFRLKRRPQGKPIAWLVGSASDLDRYGKDVPELARAAARAFWPGGLTLIVKAADGVPRAFQSEAGDIGLRMPDDALALQLIGAVGCPLAATSANFSGKPAPRSFDQADPEFLAQLPAVLEARPADAAPSGVASTVLDCTCDPPRILRQGAVTAADIAALGDGAPEAGPAAPSEPGEAAVFERISYPSHDGESRIAAYLWLPRSVSRGAAPRGIVQIAHGMSEHMLRYRAFAEHLARAGYAVCGNDHIGHGASQPDPTLRGCLPVDVGEDALVEDVHALRGIMQERFPDAPFFLFGHSMGSFVARVYLARHGAGLAGAIVCGTAFMPPAAARASSGFAALIARLRGGTYRSRLIDSLGVGAYARQVEGARTPLDWLSTDERVVDAYRADPLCGFMFSAAGYAVLTRLLADACDPRLARAVPRDLPVLIVSGERDPVGSMGEGPRKCAVQLKRAGSARVDEIMYPGMRHEILNEPQRGLVFEDVRAWIDTRCAELAGQGTESKAEAGSEAKADSGTGRETEGKRHG